MLFDVLSLQADLGLQGIREAVIFHDTCHKTPAKSVLSFVYRLSIKMQLLLFNMFYLAL